MSFPEIQIFTMHGLENHFKWIARKIGQGTVICLTKYNQLSAGLASVGFQCFILY